MTALWMVGDYTTCLCGASWKKHCVLPLCHWTKCTRKGCTGLFDLRTRRFWIANADIRKVS